MKPANIKNILIVGGGSAGWMTASTLIKEYPEHNITLVESPYVPKIGVGESTTVGFIAWINTLEIDHKDFMKYTDAAYKLSIKFTDFYSKEDGGFHYPFGDPYVGNCTQPGANDWHILKALDKNTTKQSYVEYLFPSSVMLNTNKIFIPKTLRQMDGFDFMKDMALQFDAIKFAEYLKEKYAKPRGVRHIEADINKIETDEDGIRSVTLEGGQVLEADLYIDCTGFKGLLITEALNTKFESHEDRLPVNRAWAVQIPYEDPEKEIELFTNCTALGYGWVWNAPLYSRIGTGYVYSNKFTDSESALEEFKNHLKKVHGAHRINDTLKFREIEFKSGVISKPWNKNVVAIGLSGAFLEPLESNGLRFIHEHSLLLSRMISRGFVNKFDQEAYNFEVKRDFDSFSSFVQLHYILTSRRDTDFWKYMASRDVFIDTVNFTSGGHLTSFKSEIINKITNKTLHVDRWCGFHCIAVGHEWGPVTPQVVRHWKNTYPSKNFKEIADTFKKRSEASLIKWNELIKDAPSHYQYLKENFHNEI